MPFTALHRILGRNPGVVDDELVDAAVAAGLAETDDLDWKSELPTLGAIAAGDFPKDVAAMANAGGGALVYGVKEKHTPQRVDVGDLDERYESALRSAAITAITPPVFGLEIYRVGDDGARAVVIVIPASVDGPHLIYKKEYFGAPIRNNSDTVWMKERQIESMYRARFDERRHATEALDGLYEETAAGRDTDRRAWFIAVAHPRLPLTAAKPPREEARQRFEAAEKHGIFYAGGGVHPLDSVEWVNPRPGLRRWVAVNKATSDLARWKESWTSIHHDGSVTLAAAVGGHRTRDSHNPGEVAESSGIECAVADFMGLIRATSEATGTTEYEVKVGIEWDGPEPLTILTVDTDGLRYDGTSTLLTRYVPVTTTVRGDAERLDFYWQVHDLAEDCVNQGGISNVRMISPPERVD